VYRWREHVGPAEDYEAGYRGREELRPWQERDQVRSVGEQLDPSQRARIDAEIESAIAAAFEFAEKSAFPARENLFTHVYAE